MSIELHGKREDFDIYQQYIKEIKRYPLLSREEEKTLLRKIQSGDESARQKLICANLRIVVKVAFMYRNQGLSINDLINEGNLGLIEGSKRFDPDKNIKFTSYGIWWIRQAIVQAIFEKARMVRISAANELVLRRVGKNAPVSKQHLGGSHSIDANKLAKKMGYSENRMEKILEMGLSHKSLDAKCTQSSDFSLTDKLSCNIHERPDSISQAKSLNEFIETSLHHLTPKEQKVIIYSYGLHSYKVLTLQEQGELMGLSKERIRQIRESALEKLRDLKLSRKYLIAA